MAGLESLAMGVPVIASDNRGTREYMEHGKNGFVCRYDDVDGFVRGIEAMRSLRPAQRERMAEYCIASARPFDRKYANALMRRVYTDMERRIEAEAHGEKSGDQRHYGRI